MQDFTAFINKLRKEARQQRVHIATLQRAHESQKKRRQELEEEVKDLREETNDLRRERDRLKEEIERFKQEMEQVNKTKERYQISLFDHGNFKHPESKTKKKKGGQENHKDTNRERYEDKSTYERRRVYATECGTCGKELKRVDSSKEKALLDILIKPQTVKVILEMERQWCGDCRKEVQAQDPDSLPFTEYGINIFMIVLFLRYQCLLSLKKTGLIMGLLGFPLACSVVNSLLTQAQRHLGSRYEELKQTVREGEVMYNDETGWMVRGKRAWMWIMANEDVTVYKAAESRGKGIFEELYADSDAQSMHDGYAGYESITGKERSMYCWSHMLRFCFEETHRDPPESAGILIRDRLVSIYQGKKSSQEMKKVEVRQAIEELLAVTGEQSSVLAIQKRLAKQKDGLIQALFHSPDGTNNLAERELRPVAMMRYASSGSDTYTGMEKTAVLMSVVKTQLKKPSEEYFPAMRRHILTGVASSSPNYSASFGKS